MLAQKTTLIADPIEKQAAHALMAEPETAISDAPLFSPEAKGAVLLLLLVSPKSPTEPRDK